MGYLYFISGNKPAINQNKPMTTNTYTALIDYTDGESKVESFSTKAKALAFAREEIKWELTLHAAVVENLGDDGEIEIFSEEGEQV